MKERKILSATLQWLWKFGKNESEETSEEAAASEDGKAFCSQNGQNNVADSIADGCDTSSAETVDHNFMVSFRNLGLTMLGNIQAIESVFQQDPSQMRPLENLSKTSFMGKGQATAMTALKELRKISNLLSQM
ncbi:TBC1 domain family member 5 homolog A-like [Olea europaea subsp. europaea]|uniref:TBC1 domain family member 5 homolog A-like n=1 Tax=Olea europaea subsp. europaea TaxID=158383 RepID=A0A8S0PCU1_OLEEU|nr:TBC1 domain family member 5 homolog A-like [Olea europaea subsp. europaea]